MQDWLNADDDALWGFCCNGERLRLVRDNPSLTRPAYIEADLRQMFEGEDFAGLRGALAARFTASRFGRARLARLPIALWSAGARRGAKRDWQPRDGFAMASRQHCSRSATDFWPTRRTATCANASPKASCRCPSFSASCFASSTASSSCWWRKIADCSIRPVLPSAAQKLYAEGYSLGALRDRAMRRAAWDRHHDRWEGLLIIFRALAHGEPRLGLPALGGLFDSERHRNLEAARLSNRALMEAIYRLAWLRDDSSLVPVNWRDMETEELGSVYESLLELTPRLPIDGRGFAFAEGAETKGNERKTTGSYYTPDSLVQALLDSALDPVLDRVEARPRIRPQALLEVTVIDPACGSGHFLLAAARRIATRVARARAGGVASAEDYRHALRDVVRVLHPRRGPQPHGGRADQGRALD